MVQQRYAKDAIGWWRASLLLAVGGAVFAYVTFWLVQELAALFGGRLFQISALIGALVVGLMITSFIGSLIVSRMVGWLFSLLIVTVWLVGYLLLWGVGIVLVQMSVPIYLAFWLAFGALCGFTFANQPLKKRRRANKARRSHSHAVIQSGQFGRIPSETVVLLTQQVRQVTGPILAACPQAAPEVLRQFTVSAVLERTIRDWWKNSNTEGLGAQDIDDLRSFVALAAWLVGPDPHAADAQAIYRASLVALLDDWLENWNSNGVAGPPRR